ncbi:hypothetical protein A3742_03100 [Oleiphilus sp. HI0071]|nr:hypothetical protein A3737_06120 [Oleiphilus sp. HI0065]KZY89748.1 hypothetical protein A3744_06250 [Oleiphilus sp. HI0073]KZY90300.1 hypothetical protein A3742_03100 [Oleiphilus sp. HI0071]KZZ55815.1 hypothetical protein A3760_00440 [Oleiphilus sp. HI0122]
MSLIQFSKNIIKNLLAHIKAHQFKAALKKGEYDGKLIILMYHRVLPKQDPRLATEEPGMYVTPETLDMHLSELSKIAQLVHIEEWLELAKTDALENKLYCAITFDDGWADNYEFAFPLLKKHQAPACIFLATDYIGTDTTFWPERLAAELNDYTKNNATKLKLDAFFSELGEEIDTTKLNNQNRDYISYLIQIAKQKPDDEIKSFLDALPKRKASSKDKAKYQTEMLNWEEVKEMQEAGVQFGGHTRSHLRLNNQASPDRLENEIIGCADDIKQNIGTTPTLFCYPNGDTSQNALDLVASRYAAAVTTQTGINEAYTAQAHLLKRVGVHEDVSKDSISLKAVLHRD